MEIKFMKRDGVPQAEREAHRQIQEEFHKTPFSQDWRGYAAFALARPGRGTGDDDFDLVLVTHLTIVVIELKNWHGNLLQSDGRKWYLDGEDRGDSPVAVVRRKVPKLANLMKQKLGVEKTPFISSYVVMHGKLEEMELRDEEQSVLNMQELLSFRYEHCYRNYLDRPSRFNPLDYLKDYDKFFEGPSFKPKVYYIDGFGPSGEPIFSHPKGLYSEFRALAKDDTNIQALLRQWNFLALGMDLIGENDRTFIGLRERRIFDYVSERNEELGHNLLSPVARKTSQDVTLDFAELYKLSPRYSRLTEFIHSTLPKLSRDERLDLVKALLSRFADLHDLRIAHRDVSDHCLWVDRPAKVVVSGFMAAYYPEMKTLASYRDKVKVEQSVVPEDITDGKAATPYHRDVFMLGVVAYILLYGERPPKVNDVFEWLARADDPFKGKLDDWFKGALKRDPSVRFENARAMLEALNALNKQDRAHIIDFAAFDAFKATTRERDYEPLESFADRDDYACFRSETQDGECIVKVWYGVEPDARRPDVSLRLLSFLERARAIKGCGIQGLPRVIDCGLSRGSLLLVLGWVDGSLLSEWLEANPSLERRISVAQSLVDTLERLHALDIFHGDIHPGNIVVGTEDKAVLIDVLDFHPNDEDAYTTTYLPDNYHALSPFERDRYGLAAIVADLLSTTRARPSSGALPVPEVYAELDRLFSAESISSLDLLKGTLASALKPPEEEVPEFKVTLRNLAYYGVVPGGLTDDNDTFHVSVQPDRHNAQALRFWVAGIGRQISFGWNLVNKRAEFVKVEAISQSDLLRIQIWKDDSVRIRLTLTDGAANNIDELAHFLLGLAKIKRKIQKESSGDAREQMRQGTAYPDEIISETTVSVQDIWRALIDAEEGSFCTMVVAGEKRNSPQKEGQILIPYHIDTGVIDYDPSETVQVQNLTSDGEWRYAGVLNLRDTTFGHFAELAVEKDRSTFRIGTRLRLVSLLEQASFSRRREAVKRILEEKSVIPDLIHYFESEAAASLEPLAYPVPSEEDLDIYSEGDKKLNPSQRKAFKCVVGNGPVSLLQGPPGTGKTFFIATLLHYLITKERARRILLVSQAHEAVNNALEKALDLCRARGMSFNAVRLGSESAASEAIRHLHSTSIEESYRERFKAEQKERIVQLASSLGLPKAFAVAFTELHLRLGSLERRIAKLAEPNDQADEKERISLAARVRALTETFFDIARDLYDFLEDVTPAIAFEHLEQTMMQEHEVRSLDAVKRLRQLITLSEEWLNALGSRGGNFVEFLAKSRTVVAGTCVGIGYRGAGVVQNIYDWVIIDEAGRAAPSELAVAMQTGRRILLVGDHKQLPPTFSEEVKDAIQMKFDVDDDSEYFASDFERIFNSEWGRRVGTTLLTQYRMAPAIGELVSSCFYDGKLQTERQEPPEYYDLLPKSLSK